MVFGLNGCGWFLPLQRLFFQEAEQRGVINEAPLSLSGGEDRSGCADVAISRPAARIVCTLLTAAA